MTRSSTVHTEGAQAVHTGGVHHLTLRVSDLERSRWFYETVLGLRVDQELDGKCRLRLGPGPDSTRLVLRLPLEGTPPGDRFSERRIGLDHLSLAVGSRAELERVVQRLRRAGVGTGGIAPVPGGGLLVCCRDPDNIQVEFFCDGPVDAGPGAAP